MGFGIVQRPIDIDPENPLTTGMIQFADQGDIDSIAAHDGIKIQIDIPVQVHFAIPDQRNRVTKQLYSLKVNVLAGDFEIDITGVERGAGNLSNLENFKQR